MTIETGSKAPTMATQFYNIGKEAARRSDVAEAERNFRQALLLEPNHARASHWLASILVQEQRTGDAEAVLVAAAQHGALAESLQMLAEMFEASNRLSEAAACWEKILQSAPNDYAVLMKIGGLRNRLGDLAGESECYKAALAAHPHDIDATFKLTDAIWKKDPETAVRALEALLPVHGEDPVRRAIILGFLLGRKEWWERIRRGEMPYHCAHLSELLFKYAKDVAHEFEQVTAALAAAKPDNNNVLMQYGTAKFCLGDRHGAEAIWQPETRKGSLWETVRFAPSFYQQLDSFADEDLIQRLPPLLTITPPQSDAKGTLYLSCNSTYFDAFALPMIVSLHERSPATSVHIHIMDSDDRHATQAAALLRKLGGEKYSLTVERPGFAKVSMQARCYFHAVRFIRFYNHLRTYRSPLWLMDVDAVVNRDLEDLFAKLNDHDVAMRVRPGRLEPWNQFNACIVGASTSPRSLTYFRSIAAYTAYFYQRDQLRWGIDQLAMYGVFEEAKDRGAPPSLALLGEQEVDYEYRSDGFVWCNSGVAKFQHLQRMANPSMNIPMDKSRSKFTEVFEHYWKQVETLRQER